MGVQFEKSFYLDALKAQGGNFADEGTIFDQVKASFKFSYGIIDFEAYSEKYSDKGWFGRKVIALPQALWSAVIKTLFHLTIAVIFGTLSIFFDKEDKGKCFKANIFSAARDLQESFGRIASLFHDAYGLYHIQESDFHKTCYVLYFSKIEKERKEDEDEAVQDELRRRAARAWEELGKEGERRLNLNLEAVERAFNAQGEAHMRAFDAQDRL